VRRALKVAVWAAVFLAAAGIGAIIAAHTDLFPPDVGRATGTDTPDGSPTADPSAGAAAWTGVIRSTSYHDLYVGGRCTTRWVTRLTFDLADGGAIEGTGIASLDGDRVCTSANAQINVKRIEVTVAGSWDPRGFRIRLDPGDRTPAGTTDYGGFEHTVLAGGPSTEMRVPLDTRRLASASVRMQRADEQGRGTYVSRNRLSLAAVA
jgi:hypothetical protein